MEGRNNQNSGNNNTTVINQRVRSFYNYKYYSKFNKYKIPSFQMNVYNFNQKEATLIVNEQINNITINGSKNKIIFKTKIPNVIVNGSKNEINVNY